jgi:hyperosmotically inducible periplasmic protein
MRTFHVCLLGGVLTIGLVGAVEAQEAATSKAPAADNTKVNKRDRSPAEPTADQAKETTPDREIMKKIRRAIVADKSLSTYAHNVKVISEHGKVTLKGPVHTEDEKHAIEAKAAEIAGAGNVTNDLTVKGDSKHAKKTT